MRELCFFLVLAILPQRVIPGQRGPGGWQIQRETSSSGAGSGILGIWEVDMPDKPEYDSRINSCPLTGREIDFWIAWPHVYGYSSAEVVIMAYGSANVTVTGPDLNLSFSMPPSPQVISLPLTAEITTNELVEEKGIHIVSDATISVLFRVPAGPGRAGDDVYLANPTSTLGTEYYALSYEGFHSGSEDVPGFVVLVGTEDNTIVLVHGTLVMLNRGETWQKLLPGSLGDITGTHVAADKPVAVLSGTQCSWIPRGFWYADALLEEMIAVDTWGTEYYTAPLYSPNSPDFVRMIASQNSTIVQVEHLGGSDSYTLDTGEWLELTEDSATHITSSKPIGVAQYAASYEYTGSIGDPFEMVIMPKALFKEVYKFYTPEGYNQGDFITIIAPTPGTEAELDGAGITGWLPLPGGGQYVVQPVASTGEHSVTASDPVLLYAHGYLGSGPHWPGSYGYPVGCGLHHDVGVVSIDSPGPHVRPNVPIIPAAKVGNFGNYSEAGFWVHCSIDSSLQNIYSDSVDIPLIAPDSIYQVSFTQWIPDGEGNIYDLTVYTNLETDTYRPNDTLCMQCAVTGVEEDESKSATVVAFELSQNRPNPVRGATSICYRLPGRNEVTLRIYSMGGELVRTLVHEPKEAGYYIVSWDGKDDEGRAVASGVYFYRLHAGDLSATRKMTLLR